jgi:transposase
VLRSGAPWRDLREGYGPRTTCYNRFVRWRKAGVWNKLMDAIAAAHDGDIQMIDSTSVRAHQQAATIKKGMPTIVSGDHVALRQARRQLPYHGSTRLNAAVAARL